jgi:DNA (cytosine-5)-methyltransferase 1
VRTAPPLLGSVDGLSAEQINYRFNQLMAGAEFGHTPALDDDAFSRLVGELYAKPRLFTYVDLFCGAGGSSIGLTAAGGRLLRAINHSKRAIETHMTNFGSSEHEVADIDHYDMRRLPSADILWASVICTEISPAGGKKRRTKGVNPLQMELMEEGPISQDVFEKTRATAQDVIRAAEAQRYPIIIIENVVEFVKDWKLFAWCLDGMTILDYDWQLVCVSSAHIGGPTNPWAPQRRDRIYLVFNRKDVPKPDVAPRPMSQCDTCGVVEGVQWWKKPEGTLTESGRYFLVGKYGKKTGQYVYRCPNDACRHSIVTPYERAAASVINWNDLGTRICERADAGLIPLEPTTLRRIQRGLDMFGRPTLVNSAHDDDRAYPADSTPFPSRTTKIGDGLACPPFLDANGGSWNTGASSVYAPFRARTTCEWEGLVVPAGAFIDTARANVLPTPPWAPMTTIAAGGNHHGLVVPYYTTGRATPTSQPFPTTTVRDRFGLARGGDGASLDVMQAMYRMVQWYEQARAQRFPASYLITGNNGERTAQAGNAVACNVAQWLGERCAIALNRTAALA